MLNRKNYPVVFMFLLVTMRETCRSQTTSETTITQNTPHLSPSIEGTNYCALLESSVKLSLRINLRTYHFTADIALR